MRCTFLFVFALTATVLAQSPATTTVEKSERDAVVEALGMKLSAGYVLPDAVGRIRSQAASFSAHGFYRRPGQFFSGWMLDRVSIFRIRQNRNLCASVFRSGRGRVSIGWRKMADLQGRRERRALARR